MLKLLSYPIRIVAIPIILHLPVIAQSQALQTQLDGSDISIQEFNRGIQGSPLIFKEFKSGTLIDNNGREINNIELNYDALNHVMLSKQSEDIMLSLNKFYYVTAVIDGQEFRNMSPYGIEGYARVLYDGEKIKCFESLEAVKQTTDRQTYSQVSSKYKIVSTYKNLLWYNDKISEVKRKDKGFYELFSKSAVKAYLKDNSIKLKNDDDLAIFLAHFESTLD